jgi:hypothetical protein
MEWMILYCTGKMFIEGTIMNRSKTFQTALRFAIGLIVFILAMMITVSDVLGLQAGSYRLPGSGGAVITGSNGSTDLFEEFQETIGDCQLPEEGGTYVQPPGVPEPGSLLLLGLGAGMILLRRMKRRVE